MMRNWILNKMQLDTKDKLDIVLIVIILIFLIVITYAISIYNQDAVSCLEDPIQYLEDKRNVSYHCREAKFGDVDYSSINFNDVIG